AIIELAQASGRGFLIHDELLPVGYAQKQIANLFGIDHRFSLGSGSMIMIIKRGTESKLLNHLKNKDIPAVVVGEITDRGEGYKIWQNDKKCNVNFNGEDPYWRAFFTALNAGLK